MNNLINSIIFALICLSAQAGVTLETAKQFFSPESLNSTNIYDWELLRQSQPLLMRDFARELRKTKDWKVRREVETYIAQSVVHFKITPTIDQKILDDRGGMYSRFAEVVSKGGINKDSIDVLSQHLTTIPKGPESGHEKQGVCYEGELSEFYHIDSFRLSVIRMIAIGLADMSTQNTEEFERYNNEVLCVIKIEGREKIWFDVFVQMRLDALSGIHYESLEELSGNE